MVPRLFNIYPFHYYLQSLISDKQSLSLLSSYLHPTLKVSIYNRLKKKQGGETENEGGIQSYKAYVAKPYINNTIPLVSSQ